jgi:hypothetical protein
MARRTRSLREMRLEYEAAEACGLIPADAPERKPREDRPERRPRAESRPRLKVVWQVCDMGNRVVASFDYPDKAQAEAHAADLKAKGKGNHFVRSEKVPL